jgi:hypothetical protein
MRLSRQRVYRLLEGRDGDCHWCGSAGLIIIVAVRRVDDGPFLEAICTASVQKNCLHSYSPWWLLQREYEDEFQLFQIYICYHDYREISETGFLEQVF